MEFNGTFLASIISFILFVFLMNAVLYEPFRKIVEQRNEYIDDNLNSAEANNNQADQILKDKDAKIQSARFDAKGLYTNKVDDYKSRKNDIINDAKKESVNTINDAYQNLNNVSNEAKERLKGNMTDLANDIVEKMIGYRSEVQGFDNDKVNNILYH